MKSWSRILKPESFDECAETKTFLLATVLNKIDSPKQYTQQQVYILEVLHQNLVLRSVLAASFCHWLIRCPLILFPWQQST